jgi:hypothetical protein
VTPLHHAIINEQIVGRRRSCRMILITPGGTRVHIRANLSLVLTTPEIFISAVVSPEQNTESDRCRAYDDRQPIDEAPPK